MKILALEFSCDERSVAIFENETGDSPVALCVASEKSGRATHAVALIQNVLRQADWEREQIEVIAVGLGPGSYTGIRAAIAFAQGWQLARDIKIVGISSGECLAFQAQKKKLFGQINIIIDAQRNEFYVATYEISETIRRQIKPLAIVPFSEIETRAVNGEVIIGPDSTNWFHEARNLFPNAESLAQLAARHPDFVSGEKLEPIYLRETSFIKAPPTRVIL
ncbi:MAG: tRNA (adenosine(37)-N6)-threonylcarbamoyltransferase complex dimerization subunit type 1 TsaB [Verrucomicrobiota bacterium]|nr:tRNA (adenosine(37)-N6)-threonylcarbamoyltransferase complex dimerization subunit type 1 TsaB [Verrucomicrobiota bacterium]